MIAAFSAGRPNASYPIGRSTCMPLRRRSVRDHVADRVVQRVPHVEVAGRDTAASRRRTTCGARRRPARRDRGSGRGTTSRRPRPSAISPRLPVGRSAPSSPSLRRSSGIRVQKSLSCGEAQGRSSRLSPQVSLGHVRSRNISLIVPPSSRSDHSCALRPVRWRDDNREQGERTMPLVSMRQLLDEAARGGYGVGAFNVNNMEQIQAIMEAARETSSPVIIQASRGARSYTNDRFLWHLMQAAVELYPGDPRRAPPRPRQRARDLHLRDRPRLHERDDGRLARGRRQDAGVVRLQRRRHEGGRRVRPRARRHGRGRDRHARRGRGRTWLRRGAPDRSGRGRRVRARDGRRRARRRVRHLPRRLQVRAGARPATCSRWT